MSEQRVRAVPKSIELEAVIIRADGSREPLGTVARWDRNPFKRALWRLQRRRGPRRLS
jgi:hypothetical protein